MLSFKCQVSRAARRAVFPYLHTSSLTLGEVLLAKQSQFRAAGRRPVERQIWQTKAISGWRLEAGGAVMWPSRPRLGMKKRPQPHAEAANDSPPRAGVPHGRRICRTEASSGWRLQVGGRRRGGCAKQSQFSGPRPGATGATGARIWARGGVNRANRGKIGLTWLRSLLKS